MLEVIEAEILVLDGIAHGFFTSKGGVSTGVYASLNLGPGSADHPSLVTENRRRATEHLAGPGASLSTLYQVHGRRVVEVTGPWSGQASTRGEAPGSDAPESEAPRADTPKADTSNAGAPKAEASNAGAPKADAANANATLAVASNAGAPKADAMVTKQPGLLLGILSADCVPVLLADEQSKVVGAAHAGWRGALAGVVENTVRAMTGLGASPANIRAAIGPAIQQLSYEVGPELKSAFLERSDDYERYFIIGKDDRFQLDLPGFVRDRLAASGVINCEVSPADTYTDENRFFSYRRASHRSQPDYGRQLSAICLHPGTKIAR